MNNAALTTQLEEWTREMRHVASEQPGTGACAVGSAMDLWLWTFKHVQKRNADEPSDRERDLSSLSDALSSLLSARSLILNVAMTASAVGEGSTSFVTDLCHVQSARAAGEVGYSCAEVVFGRLAHPTWDPTCEACVQAEDVDALEGIVPGISYGARLAEDVVEADGSHADKAGPCVSLRGLQGFISRRNRLDSCLSGARTAKDRAMRALAEISVS
ncbi:MAG TPA: hypothetical protein QF650_06685 [Vicinamibacterales bacterium]|jgi:hypothetical protein|nr:hypothetical protein [Acidobacteriota bacterium]MDP7338658.1 hypothetical protein [Vicinamibacterales bacterium]HJO38278.1 hypothetical protein [Vicinamibacterales bacterium]|tara:strand:- start:1675 stop:2322 length:648 start_codon:yes stop_codon:yes gene_type:complete